MSAIAAISANDNTPTAHTFNPQSCAVGRSVLATSVATLPQGNETLVLDFSPRTAQRATYRSRLALSYPIEHTDGDGLTTVQHTARATLEFVVPDTMESADRTHFFTVLKNLLAQTEVQKYVTDLEPLY